MASLAAAVLLGATCTAPFFIWGNPYPEGVVPYWLWGTLTVAGVAALAAWLPGKWFADLSGRVRALLDRPPPLAFALLVGALATALSLAFAVYVFRRSATTSDEIAQPGRVEAVVEAQVLHPWPPRGGSQGLGQLAA